MSVNQYTIDVERLLRESSIKENFYKSLLIREIDGYNPLTSSDITTMSSYNALRYLYRNYYDLRSEKKKEINPLKNIELVKNYLNDFSLSPLFSESIDYDFKESIVDIHTKSIFAFLNTEAYKNFNIRRFKYFIKRESLKKNNIGYTNDFFSYIIQVNPLLYTFIINDSKNKDKLTDMDADLFLESNLYSTLFNNEDYIMKGNQFAISLWLNVVNTEFTSREIYDEEDGITVVGYDTRYKNEKLLLRDDFTKEYFSILDNGEKYYNFGDNEEPEKIEDISKRGHLFYDSLLELLFKRIESIIKIDNEESNSDIIKNYEMIKHMISDISMKCGYEKKGFPFELYLAMDDKLNNLTFFNNNENESIVKLYKTCKDRMGEMLHNVFNIAFTDVFAKFFRILPFVMSPAYNINIQSPAMNILYMSFTLMAIKLAYQNNKESYEKIINKLFNEILLNINELNESDINGLYYKIFNDKELFDKEFKAALSKVLSLLILNSSAVNDESYYSVDKFRSYAESGEDIEDNILVDKAVILLSEFFTKCESLRYFDASTFCIDMNKLKDDSNIRNIMKIFSDSLMESCYIHMNILGSESFFNGDAPSHLNIVNSLFKSNLLKNLVGLDNTRVSKRNMNLVESWGINRNQYLTNSYHSYMSVINLYISLAYSIQITISNLSINNFNIGPYDNNKLIRPISIWTIIKRYSLHMLYMNNNSYGIWNDTTISDSNINEIQKIMVSQRIKLLTYGLHLRVWFNDGYIFYTNYKKLMNDYNGDINKVISIISDMKNESSMKLFNENMSSICVPMPNIGLSLYPIAGSFTLLSNAICMREYLNDNAEIIVNLIHHGLKDILIGDSMSSILSERLDNVRSSLSLDKNISFNNINGLMQKVINVLGESTFHELALSSNLDILYRDVIRKYILDNGPECKFLTNSKFDYEFFKTNDQSCSYQLAYRNTIFQRIISNLIKGKNNVGGYTLLHNIISLYRVSLMNFNTWHSNDNIISKYYNSYFGLSSMNSVFIKEYEKGINKVLDDKSRYGIFGLILKYLYNGNRYNNHNPISNLFSVNNAKISFEDCIINFTCGGTIFAFCESPMMLLLYNNIDFGQGFIEPSSEQLYMLGRDLFGRIYLTMKRLYVDLTMDGNPFIKIEHDNPEYSDGEVKSTFIKDCISQFYMLTNNTNNNDNSRKFYSNLMNNDELYDFITIFSQFMDYDFIIYNICNLIDSKVDYRVRGKENKEVINYFNTIVSNRGRDISLFNEYCKNIDMIDNQLNYIINSIIERKIGTIINDNNIDNEKEVIDKYNDSIKELESHKNNINSNYPISIKDSIDSFNILESESNTLFKIYIKFKYIGITKEEYEKLNDNERKEYDEILSSDIVVDYEKAISELEIKLSQLKRMKLLKEGNYEEVLDNPEKEFYDLLSKNPDINLLIYQKLDRIEKKFDSIRDILIDTNHMLRTLIEKNVIKESDIGEIIKVDESKTNNESPIDSQIFSNKINDSQFNSDLPVILESKKNNPPCQPYENEDKTTITFFNNLCEKCTVVQDLRFEELSDEEKEKIIIEFDETKHDYYQESLSIEYTENELNSYYSVVNNPRACYDRFLYAPSIYLERYIPKYLNSNNEPSGIDIYKALKQEIPLYSIDSSRLLLSFHNIPISFNQKLEFILSDIKERIGINEEDFSQKIIELIEEFKLKDFWDNNDIKLVDRMNLVKGFQDKVNNLK